MKSTASEPDPRFFPSIYKSMEKNSVRNSQYRPKTRLIRGMSFIPGYSNFLRQTWLGTGQKVWGGGGGGPEQRGGGS